METPRTPRTNTHTYFFREFEAIEIIRDRLIAPRSSKGVSTAIWSVGCSTGDEPYSLAIAAAEVGGLVEILGSDVRRDALETAQRGLYSPRSLRHSTDAHRRRWFSPDEEQDEQQYLIDDQLRRSISWTVHDVVDDGPLRPKKKRTLWNVILCRNVFLYHDESRIIKAISQLTQVLAPDGWLLVGASEWLSTKLLSQLSEDAELEFDVVGDVMVYRRPSGKKRRPHPRRVPLPTGPSQPESDTAVTNVASAAAEPKSGPTDRIDVLRAAGDRLLDAGQVERARDAFCNAIESNPLLPDLHLRLALACLRLQAEGSAKEALRRSLFLDPGLWPAALLLGDIVRGDDREAARLYFTQARDALLRDPTDSEEAHAALSPFLCGKGAALEALRLRLNALKGKK